MAHICSEVFLLLKGSLNVVARVAKNNIIYGSRYQCRCLYSVPDLLAGGGGIGHDYGLSQRTSQFTRS